jgi:Putative restriction endonuclease
MVTTVMGLAPRHHRYTYVDYVALEADSSTKHEFLDGEIYAMAGGGSEDHSALAAEVLYTLGNALGDRPCRVHTSDLRLYVEARGLATFPSAGGWTTRVAITGGQVAVDSLQAMLIVDQIYRGSRVG